MTGDMCGRFVQYFEEVVLAKLLGLDALEASEVFRNFNVAPRQGVAVVRLWHTLSVQPVIPSPVAIRPAAS
jgi:putative SOS response-associated peptidase YedK